MDLTAQVDAYCERTDFSFWAEPLNAWTNLAFLVAAAAAWSYGRGKPGMTGLAPVMILLVAGIGVGSFLFHTFATGWASLADVLPIAGYIHLFFGLAMRRMLGRSVPTSVFLTILFFASSFLIVRLVSPLIGSSAGYAPALLALFGVGGHMLATGRAQGATLLLAGGVFLVSLTCRILDEPLCGTVSFGLHFLWHVLNALVLYITLRALLSTSPPGAPATDRRAAAGTA